MAFAATPAERLRVAIRALIEQMQLHQSDLLLIYQETHLLKGEALDIIFSRVSGFVDYFADLILQSPCWRASECRNLGTTANILTLFQPS